MNQSILSKIFFFWLSVVLVRYLFYYEIHQALWIMSIFIDAALLGGGLFYVIMSMRALFRRYTNWFGATTIIVLAVIYIFGFTSFGYDLGMYSRLWRNESEYMRQVKLIIGAKSKSERDKFQYPTIADEGPPVRVAFSWGGIIDNWHGIVYDPTGEVLKASEFKRDWSNWNDPKLHEVKKLFGGDMTSAKHLWGPWYYCTFT